MVYTWQFFLLDSCFVHTRVWKKMENLELYVLKLQGCLMQYEKVLSFLKKFSNVGLKSLSQNLAFTYQSIKFIPPLSPFFLQKFCELAFLIFF